MWVPTGLCMTAPGKLINQISTMKPIHKLIFILWLAIMLCISKGYAQIQISSATTVASLSIMKKGTYAFFNGKDSIYFSVDTGTVVRTIKIPVFQTIDSSGIIKAYLVLHPCPTAPACPPAKQRTVNGFPAWDPVNKKWIYPYDDGTVSGL